jgi:hypothetical protein
MDQYVCHVRNLHMYQVPGMRHYIGLEAFFMFSVTALVRPFEVRIDPSTSKWIRVNMTLT